MLTSRSPVFGTGIAAIPEGTEGAVSVVFAPAKLWWLLLSILWRAATRRPVTLGEDGGTTVPAAVTVADVLVDLLLDVARPLLPRAFGG